MAIIAATATYQARCLLFMSQETGKIPPGEKGVMRKTFSMQRRPALKKKAKRMVQMTFENCRRNTKFWE
jgi:hypothetical protein